MDGSKYTRRPRSDARVDFFTLVLFVAALQVEYCTYVVASMMMETNADDRLGEKLKKPGHSMTAVQGDWNSISLCKVEFRKGACMHNYRATGIIFPYPRNDTDMWARERLTVDLLHVLSP
jgi:hypothetical protein